MIKTLIDPIIRRPDGIQVAALVFKRTAKGIKVLIVTSRRSKRWIIPKGWPIKGKSLADTAGTEAWEEAGFTNPLAPPLEIGTFRYEKQLTSGVPIPITVHIFALETDELAKKFPEKGQRRRKWVTPKRAKALLKNDDISSALETLLKSQK
jgi:8-oxo-dGTP pyrophosphatase MutT (NUDIX family)